MVANTAEALCAGKGLSFGAVGCNIQSIEGHGTIVASRCTSEDKRRVLSLSFVDATNYFQVTSIEEEKNEAFVSRARGVCVEFGAGAGVRVDGIGAEE